MLNDWFKNLAPLSQPIRSKTKTKHDLLTDVFALFVLATCTSIDWFTGLSTVFFVPSQSDKTKNCSIIIIIIIIIAVVVKLLIAP